MSSKATPSSPAREAATSGFRSAGFLPFNVKQCRRTGYLFWSTNALATGKVMQNIAPSNVSPTLWAPYELSFEGPAAGNPYVDVTLSAVFTKGDRALEVPGFYDGDGIYRLRFLPDVVGIWRYRTTSNTVALNDLSGGVERRPRQARRPWSGPGRRKIPFPLRRRQSLPRHRHHRLCMELAGRRLGRGHIGDPQAGAIYQNPDVRFPQALPLQPE